MLKNSKSQEDTDEEARKLLSLLSFDFGTEFDVGDEEGILFFFAGFLARAESKVITCESCIALFVLSKDPPKINFGEVLGDDPGDSKAKFLKAINRGGLFTPTDALYICVLHARQLYNEVFDKSENEKKFLSVQNQHHVFSAMFEMKMSNDVNCSGILNQTCEHSHKFSARLGSIGGRAFNTFAKNFTSEIKDKIHQGRKRKSKGKTQKSSAERKIAKLNNQ